MSKDNKTYEGYLDYIISSFELFAIKDAMDIIEHIEIENEISNNNWFEVYKECFYFYIHVMLRLTQKFHGRAYLVEIQNRAFPLFLNKLREHKTSMHLEIERDFNNKLVDFVNEREIMYSRSRAIMSEQSIEVGRDVINTCVELICKQIQLGEMKMFERTKLLTILGVSLQALQKINIENHIKNIVDEIRG